MNTIRSWLITLDWEKLFKPKALELLQRIWSNCAVKVDMIILRLLTVVCGLMRESNVKAHFTELDFGEPNVLWTMTAAKPGE
jgi:hypothetical protein